MSNRTEEKGDGAVVILNCEWMANLKEKVEKTPMKDVRVERATIFRVPDNIRAGDTNEACRHGEAYKPKIVSLGPYHHPDEALEVWNNRLKWPCLKRLLERSSDKTQAMEKCIDKIKERERELRSEYEEEVEMTSNEFVEMMLLDCCFVLELLLEQAEEKERRAREKQLTEEMKKTTKNQLPSLCKVFNLCPLIREMYGSTPLPTHQQTRSKEEKQQVRRNPSAPAASSSEQEAVPTKQSKQPEEEGTLIQQWQWAEPLIAHDLLMLENQIPLSLLRELHGIILSHDKSFSMDELILSFFKEISLTKHLKKIPEASCHHLLHLFHSCLTPIKPPIITRAMPGYDGLDAQVVVEAHGTSVIPCARDLIASGVKVRRKRGDACSSFLDLSFSSGLLEIPEIHINDSTNTLLRNLIAFEQCYPKVDNCLTTYACFMDSVIDNSADVALLRRKHVLTRGLGSDEEVVKLFNSMCKEVMIDPNNCYLEKTIKEVNKYYSNEFNQIRAIYTYNYDYINKRWVIGSIAAIILFVLTFLQTVYSMCDSCHKH